jgi:photosystem II stability/assembly factor-like uncharacterized protein
MNTKAQSRRLHPSITSRVLIRLIALAGMLCIANIAIAQGLQWMHLLSPGVGWVTSSGALFWTTDNGRHWKNITPHGDGGIASVFFLDTSTGWVLMSRYEEPEPRFDLAFTRDSGVTWSLTHLKIPVNPNEYTLAPQGDMQFTDAMHGWMNLSVQSGSAFNFGLLFRTTDGGKTWVWSPGPGRAGQIRFIDQWNGWGIGLEDAELWTTHDGAATWQQVSLAPPPEVQPAETIVYQLPVFADNKHGALTVSFSASANDRNATAKGSRVALFVTADAGRTWKFDRILAHLGHWHGILQLAVADSILITAEEGSDNVLTLRKASLKTKSNVTEASAKVADNGGVDAVSFASTQQGWVLISGSRCSWPTRCPPQLLSTIDGGSSWSNIAPWKPKGNEPQAVPGQPIHLKWQPAGILRPLSADGVSRHLGFDKCEILGEDEMQYLWSGWSYQDAGVYIGGINHRCEEPDSDWIAAVEGEGWGIIP